jgi:nucleoside-diphosphate-sugar epimerase
MKKTKADESTLPKTESMPANPITLYGADKLASELMGYCYAQTFGLEFACAVFQCFWLPERPRQSLLRRHFSFSQSSSSWNRSLAEATQ